MADSVIGDLRGMSSHLHTFTYLWRIENFGKLDSTVGKYYDSDFFQPEDANNKLNMCLRIYPGGIKPGFISCFLYSKVSSVPEDGVFVNCKIEFQSNRGAELCHSDCKGLLQPGKECGCPTFVKLQTVTTRIPDDTLIVLVEGLYSTSAVTKNKSTEYTTVKNHLQNHVDDLWRLQDIGVYSDVRIVVGDRSCDAHMGLLKVRAPKLASEAKYLAGKKRLDITGFSFYIVERLLEFLYAGRTDILTYKQALDLLRAADKYQIYELKNYCSSYLILHMKNENVVQMLLTAYEFSADLLKREATKHLIENSSNINREQRKKLHEEGPNIMFDIIEAMNNRESDADFPAKKLRKSSESF